MIFNSFQFLFFFIIVTTLFFALQHRYRWIMLLIASCYFYMAFVPVYILILGFTIIVDYYAGIAIENAVGRKRRLFLICSLIANIGILAVFKYFNFINFNLSVLLERFDVSNPVPFLKILLPIGLSFHTFQAMSYTIEVYRGNQKAERHFGIYSLYVMFYPQLVAGPIERPQNLLHQFHEVHKFDYFNVTSGLKLMVWGLFKKVVIADRLAPMVDMIYSSPHEYNSFGLALGTVFFAFQIYCDFSGYSDMAIGAARVMGFTLMKNFDNPYQSKSIAEFWRRWHISLSQWFRDYVYIPLGGNRVAVPRMYFNLFVVFLISGLWHGANWTYIVWGALHGFYLIFALATQKIRDRINHTLYLDRIPFLQNAVTFALVCFAWIFFRATNIGDAVYISTHLLTGIPEVVKKVLAHQSFLQSYGVPIMELLQAILLIGLLCVIQLLQSHTKIVDRFAASPIYVRWAGYFALVFAILILGEFDTREFIYFQF